jgi:hypothetical protein
MSNTDQGSGMEGPGSQATLVNDQVSAQGITIFGVCFLVFTTLIFYFLVTTWPVLVPDTSVPAYATSKFMFKPFRLFGQGPYDWEPDLRMLLTVIIAGAIGSLIHTLTSFGDYVGNRRLGTSWLWWFILRTPIGVALAIVAYLILRGGLIVPTLQTTKETDLQGATLLLNPYAIAAFAALAGMFSRQATDKLREVFETVFTPQKPVKRDDPLNTGSELKIEPATLTMGQDQVLTITGRGFQKDTTATIDGKTRTFTWKSETEGTVTTLPEDVEKTGQLRLVITNPNKDTFTKTIEVVAPTTAVKPIISPTTPATLTSTSPKSLIVIGQGFQAGCTATIGGEARPVTFGDGTKVTVALEDKDIATPRTINLVIKNSGADGQASEPYAITVT